MRSIIASLAIASATVVAAPVLMGPAPALAQVAGYPTYEDVGLTWTRGPSVRDMARFYRTTRHDGRRGVATVLCTPDADGRLDCQILDEDPSDREFGLAGVRVMERARVASVDGGSPAGRSFAFTLRFGNWPSSALPDRFQPVSQGLLWVERPTLVGRWTMSGQDRGDRVAATIECRAAADGSLNDCAVVSADRPDFGEAARLSMLAARVERADSQPLEGSPLRWTLAVERQSGCGAGGGRGGAYPQTSTGTGPTVGADPATAHEWSGSSVARGQEPGATQSGMPGCQAAMVQVVGD